MTDAFTPEHALGYLRSLSADIREGAVLGLDGKLLAGLGALAEPARALLASAHVAEDIEVTTAGGSVFAARSDTHAIVLVCGPFALGSLVRSDLRVVLGDLAGATAGRVA